MFSMFYGVQQFTEQRYGNEFNAAMNGGGFILLWWTFNINTEQDIINVRG